MEKTIEIKAGQCAELPGGLQIECKDIIAEEIAPGPPGDYPAGSGITAYFKVSHNAEMREFDLCKLSEGYGSRLKFTWNEIEITLLDIGGNSAKLSIKYG